MARKKPSPEREDSGGAAFSLLLVGAVAVLVVVMAMLLGLAVFNARVLH